MAQDDIDTVLDFDNPDTRRRFMTNAGTWRGLKTVKVKAKRATRSTRANAFYWSAVVTPFFQFLREQDPCINEVEQAHIEIKRNVLGTQPIQVGKVTVRAVRTTHDMDTAAFMDFVERARAWLHTMVGIETCDPGEYGVVPATTVTSGPPVPRRMLEKREVANA